MSPTEISRSSSSRVATPWMDRAHAYLGLRELTSVGTLNPTIVGWLEKHTKFPKEIINARTSWCAAACCAWLEEAKVQSPHSARARDFLAWGISLRFPIYGCALIFERGDPKLGQGHVGFCDLTPPLPDPPAVLTLGGNQGNRVSVVAQDMLRLLGARWPLGWPLPDNAVTGALAAPTTRQEKKP